MYLEQYGKAHSGSFYLVSLISCVDAISKRDHLDSCVICDAGVKVDDLTPINSDNRIAIKWATSEKLTAKHIDVQGHFTRDLHQNGNLGISYVARKDIDADIFTKPLDSIKHERTGRRIGLVGSFEETC